LDVGQTSLFQDSVYLDGGSGPFRQCLERSAPVVRILVPSTPRSLDERLLPLLDRPTGIRVSPILVDPEVSSESAEREGIVGSCLSVVAGASLVSSTSRVGDGRAKDNEAPVPSLDEQLPDATSSQRVAHSDRLENIRQRFRVKRFSEEVIGLLLGANRPTTNTSYQSAWNSWRDWCSERDFDPLSNALANILQYLTDLHKNGYASRSINVHRSMLSMTLDPIEGTSVGEHPLVIQLLKGCYNANPPRPRYETTWDTDVVIDYVASLGNDQSLDFVQLSYKLVTLLALVTLMRISELASISCASVSLSSSKVTFSLLRLRKKQVSGPLVTFSVPAFTGSLVCPVNCFSEYWKRTSSMRDVSCPSLFVITKRPYTGASSSTIGRWIKSCITDAGIDGSVFSAHSTRGAGASKASASGVATDAILRAASWSSESTFARHYNRTIISPSPVPAAIISQTSSR